MKLYDYPNFSAANPWQVKTIDTAAPMEVVRSSRWPPPADCPLVHLSWEHWPLRDAHSEEEAFQRADAILGSLDVCLRRGQRLLWTVHNLASHALPWKQAETRLRAGLASRAALIFLMAEKHRAALPFVPADKVAIVPHYAEENPYVVHRDPSPNRYRLFKYGAPRGDLASHLLEEIIVSPRFDKFVSDERLARESFDRTDVIVKRRFAPEEARLYAGLAHFAVFVRTPQLNSGAFTFYCASRLAVFHTTEAVQHLDVPPGIERFVMTDRELHAARLLEALAAAPLPGDEMAGWLEDRSPARVSRRWWQAALSM